MASSDWYPKRLADLVPWHANFSAQATATGVARGLTAPQVTQIGVDAAYVAAIVNFLSTVSDYAQAVTAFKDVVFDAPIGTALPAPPTLPDAIDLPVGGAAAIQARTRQYAGIIKASPTYTPAIGELYGIIPPAPGPLADPSVLRATASAGSSDVVLTLRKGGYDLIAVDMKRGAGAFVQIGVSQTAEFTDTTAPLVSGQPEQREYRVQGMLNNARVGGLSAAVSVVTVP